uniref:Uncharacterized protein n=1 Tax=Loigolactobacillus rennini TaxID=238013 RepID=A0A1K2I3I7_9LACO|nr:hypothetical protein LREN565_0056 [Loigolactobacillus rennini]
MTAVASRKKLLSVARLLQRWWLIAAEQALFSSTARLISYVDNGQAIIGSPVFTSY